MPVHDEVLRRVERGRALPRRGVDDDVVEPFDQGVHERLDAAGARREVVGDDQRARHRAITARRSARDVPLMITRSS